MNKAYEKGFMDKCAEHGVDPGALVKIASSLPAWFIKGVQKSWKGGYPARKVFTSEQMQTIGNMARRSGRGLEARKAKFLDDAATYLGENFPFLQRGTQLTPEGALRQMQALYGVHALPSAQKFSKMTRIKRMLEAAAKGDYVASSGKNTFSVGLPGHYASGDRKVRGLMQQRRRELYSASPSKRRKILANYDKWLGGQPQSLDDLMKRIRV